MRTRDQLQAKRRRREKWRKVTYSIPWNLFLITLGSFLLAFGLKSIAIPQGFISGGMSGLSLLMFYLFGTLDPGMWYYILNLPVFLLGFFFVSRRFFLYSLYGTLAVGFALSVITYTSPIHDPILAVLAAGTLLGAGLGVALRSLGSTGGTDIVAVFLNQRFNLRIGQVGFLFNCLLFLASSLYLALDTVLYSIGMVFIASSVTDYFLRLFNQRKMVLVVSEKPDDISRKIQKHVHRGVTFVYGQGAFTGQPKKIVLTVVNNIQLKRLEEAIFAIDPHAFTIIGDTWNVLGTGFSERKVY
ncbi:MAG: YitT family protein [Desulfovibrionales bacterium]